MINVYIYICCNYFLISHVRDFLLQVQLFGGCDVFVLAGIVADDETPEYVPENGDNACRKKIRPNQKG